MSASAIIRKAVVFALRRVVGVSGTRKLLLVVRAPRIGIGDQNAEGRARGLALKNAADDPEGIGLNARR